METPEIIERYLQLGTGPEHAATAACFTPDATVSDEGRTYRGRAEIQAWREDLAGRFTYTVKVLAADGDGAGGYRVRTLVEGDFPGGRVELTYGFRLRDGLIGELAIG
jgi:hypothetical protein